MLIFFESYGYKPHLENVKSLIKNIKRDIYQRKGTANSASMLFGALFPEVESVSVGNSNGVAFNDDTYYTNLSELADIMIHQKACITVFGDSINNPGTGTGNMRHGYIREWKPNYWRGIVMHPSSGNRYDSRFWLTDLTGNPDGEDHDNDDDPDDLIFFLTAPDLVKLTQHLIMALPRPAPNPMMADFLQELPKIQLNTMV